MINRLAIIGVGMIGSSLDDFVLPRLLLVKLLACLIEYFLHRIVAVHQANESVGCRIESMVASIEAVSQNIPWLSPVDMTGNFGGAEGTRAGCPLPFSRI